MTKQPVKIAVIDNNKSYLDSLVSVLKTEGFDVVTALDPKSGKRVLKQHGLDLAIVDIRLTADADETDRSGLDLVKLAQKQGSRVPIIMLTGYPGYQHVKEALGPGIEYPQVAVDYVVKKDGPYAVLTAITKALKKKPDPILISVQKRERVLFWLRNIMAILGMVLILATVVAVMAGVADAAVPAGVTAVIISAIWRLFGTQHKQAQKRLEELQNSRKSDGK